MEREILFRTRSTFSNKWYYSRDIGCFERMKTPLNFKTLGQYIGLKDKNGKKIFEGDIIKETNAVEVNICECIYSNKMASFCLQLINSKPENNEICVLPFSALIDYQFEVIGNIHDNPELLKD